MDPIEGQSVGSRLPVVDQRLMVRGWSLWVRVHILIIGDIVDFALVGSEEVDVGGGSSTPEVLDVFGGCTEKVGSVDDRGLPVSLSVSTMTMVAGPFHLILGPVPAASLQ